MKRIFLSLLFMAICLFANAQQSIDPRIQELYGDKTQEMVGNDPVRLNFLTNFLEKRFEIIKTDNNKLDDKSIKLSTVVLLNKYNPTLQRDEQFDPETFNPLKYNLDFTTTLTKVYRVDNTDYIIVIKPQTTNNH